MAALQAEGPNAEQIRYWNENSGPRWAAMQEAVDAQLEPFGLDAMERSAIRAGEHVLDVGCGCGGTTIELARRVGASGSVLGIDLSHPMLEVARRRAVGTVAKFENADAQTHAFEPESFDVVFSRFGVMFFSDPPAAFANLLRALRRGGRLAFVCWQPFEKNPWAAVPLRAVARHVTLQPPPPPGAPGPFAFADPALVRDILTRAGFAEVAVEPREKPAEVGGASNLEGAVSFLLQVGPAGNALRDVDESTRQRAIVDLRDAIRPFEKNGRVRMDSAAWIVTASRGQST